MKPPPKPPLIPPVFYDKWALITLVANCLALWLNLFFAWNNRDSNALLFIDCIGAACALGCLWRFGRTLRGAWHDWQELRRQYDELFNREGEDNGNEEN